VKVKSILYHSSWDRNCSILLACEVLLEVTKSLNSFYFPKQQDNTNNSILNQLASKLSIARRNYSKQASSSSFLEKLNSMEMQVLRLKPHGLRMDRAILGWREKYPLKIAFNTLKVDQLIERYTDNLKALKKFHESISNT
jgi:hypothetical protein